MGPLHAAKVTSGSKTEPISTSFTRTSPQPAQIMNSNGKSRSKLRRRINRGLYTKLAVCGMLCFLVAPSFGQQVDDKPLIDAHLSSLLLAFDASRLTGDARRTFDVLTLIIEDVDKASTAGARDGYLQEFLIKSQDFVRAYPNSLQLWTLRAVAALEVNRPSAGREACQRMIGLKAGDLDDPKIRRVLAMLDREGWFNPKPSDSVPITDPNTAKPAPEKVQGTTNAPLVNGADSTQPAIDPKKSRARPSLRIPPPAIFEDNPVGTSNIGPVAFSAKWSAYGAYVHKVTEAIQIQWDRILIESRTEPPSNTVVTVKFTMDFHGKVTSIIDVENTSSKWGKQSCLDAITTTAPYGEWTDDMIATLGTSQELTFRFYYQ